VKTNKNVFLIIGSHTLCSKGKETFTETNHFRDVFAALGLMLDLMLEPYSVPSEKSCVTDSLMKLIKESSAPNNAGHTSLNSFGKVNKKFCRFVIDILSVQFVFNNWYPFASQSAPSPYVKDTPEDVTCHIVHNQKVLLSFCFKINPHTSMVLFREEKMNRLGWPVPSLKTFFSSAVTLKHKVEKGIILSWDNYAWNTVSEYLLCSLFYATIVLQPKLNFVEECIWIHHWVILQFVSPLFTAPPLLNLREPGPDGFMRYVFKHENWHRFVHTVDDELELEHHTRHGVSPTFGVVWLGTRLAHLEE
jgi:hypothetical protein